MAAGLYNFTVEQGTTLDVKLIWKDSSDVPVPLAGYTARMQVRQTIATVTTLHEFTTENAGIVLGPAAGEIHIKATAVETAGWDWPVAIGSTSAKGVYDLEMVSAGGVVIRLLRGEITLDPEVTR